MIQKMSNEISSRSNRIDVLKGIAILLVILGHAIIGITQSLHGKEMVLHGGVLVLNEVIYSFHMPLFFIVAGIYSEKWAALPIKRAFKSKALRLIYPYFIWSTILAVAMELAKGSTNGGLGLVDLFKSPIVPFSEFWFIYILFFIHILWYLIHKLTGNNFKSRQIFFYIALLLYVLSPILPDFWITERLCKYALFFSIGLFVLPLSLEDKKISFKFFFSIFILFLFAESFYVSSQVKQILRGYVTYFLFLATSILGTILSWSVSCCIDKHTNKFNNILSYMGKHSMTIYCSHLLFLAGTRIVILKLLGGNYYPWSTLIFSILITTICCITIAKVMDKYIWIKKILFG